jgi:hypothetical protein
MRRVSGCLPEGLAKPAAKSLDNLRRGNVSKEVCDEQVIEKPPKPEKAGGPRQICSPRLVDRKSGGAA